jgi:hypothetical protein
VKNNIPDPESNNVRIFSTKIAEAIREVLGSQALHPASVMGVLAYHQSALGSTYQSLLMPAPSAPPIILTPPGFKVPLPPPPSSPKP